MTDDVDTAARVIAGMVDETQQARAIEAYGDQREREALERAAKVINEQIMHRHMHRHRNYKLGLEAAEAAVIALIPKCPANV